jgi:hypothetical protein
MTRTSTISAALAQAFAPWRPETESAEQFFWVLETVPAQIQRGSSSANKRIHRIYFTYG